jgi:hypothetical protein
VSPQVSQPSAGVLLLSRTLVATLLLNVALIALRRDLSIREDEISNYLVGDLHWLAAVALGLLSAGGALVAVAVRASGEPSRAGLSTSLFVYSFGVLVGLT